MREQEHQDLEAAYDYHLKSAPAYVEVELTEACNQRCTFCYHPRNPRHSTIIFDVLDRLAEAGVPKLMLIGGEPTVHPQFREIAKRACEQFCAVNLQTNGIALASDLPQYLADIGLSGVNITINGLEGIHEHLTALRGSYRIALDAARRVLATKKLQLWVNTVLTSQNYQTFVPHLEALYEAGVRAFTVTRFSAIGHGAAQAGLGLSRDQLVGTLAAAKTFLDSHPGASLQVANGVPRCAVPKELWALLGTCEFGSFNFYTDIEGNVLHCGMLRTKMGNIFKQSFGDIKAGCESCRLVGSLRAVPPRCVHCEYLKSCKGGCRAAAVAGTGDICGADPYMVN